VPADKDTVKMLRDSVENVTVAADDVLTLDLSGHVLKAAAAGSVIKNEGTLTVADSSETNNIHYFTVNANGLWVWSPSVTSGETYTFDAVNGLKKNGEAPSSIPVENDIVKVVGGCVTGGTGHSVGVGDCQGGGINSQNTSVLTLVGGNIIGNSADKGGGIIAGNVTMDGGAVCGNTATNKGAGIFVSSRLSFKSGFVSCNVSASDGGGIFGFQATVCMNGGTVSYNEA